MDTTVLVEAEELKFSQDCEIITSDCREAETGRVMGLCGRGLGNWEPGTRRGGI